MTKAKDHYGEVLMVPIYGPAAKAMTPLMTKDHLGGKGFGLVKMANMGIPVPPAYILPTPLCREYMLSPAATMFYVKETVIPAIKADLTSIFGYMPLVSVRSGARDSMPGMMDTILNVGLDTPTWKEWIARLGKHCARDCWTRLVESFTNVVAGVEKGDLQGKTDKAQCALYAKAMGHKFPDADGQLLEAIEAVFKSWGNERAKSYRRMNGISEELGTACVVQAMVFGNMDAQSCTGVLFSRDGSTGVKAIMGEYVINGQGEDVVNGGGAVKLPVADLHTWNPGVHAELVATTAKLEAEWRDMVDIEFTVQSGKLWVLQVRAGKRTAQAAIRIALDMNAEGTLSVAEAVLERVTLSQFFAARRPVINPEFSVEPDAKGLPASMGIAVGRVVFSSKEAVSAAAEGPVILLAEETNPDDIEGMNAAKGILTKLGGATCHAAVVARGMDKVCVVGCEALVKAGKGWAVEQGNVKKIIKEGDWISLCGVTGRVWLTAVPVVDGSNSEEVKTFEALALSLVDFLQVATTPAEVRPKGTLILAYHFSPEELAKAVSQLERGIIDLRTPADLFAAEDVALLGCTGQLAPAPATAFTSAMVHVVCKAVSAPGKLKYIGNNYLTGAHIASLVKAGVNPIHTVNSLEGLIMADGLCLMAPTWGSGLVDGEVVIKVRKMKAALGEKLEPLKITDRATIDEFSKGTVAMSALQVLQSLLRAA